MKALKDSGELSWGLKKKQRQQREAQCYWNRRGRRVSSSILKWTLAITLVFSVALYANLVDEKHVREKETQLGAIRTLVNNYLAAKPSRRDWALNHSDMETKEFVALLEGRKAELEGVLVRCKDVSPLTSRIFEKFHDLKPTMFRNGGSYDARLADGGTSPLLFGGWEICFFSQGDMKHFRFPAYAYWRSDWKAVVIADLEWPTPILGGLLYLTLGHGLREITGHAERTTQTFSAIEPPGSREAEMHELQAKVVDFLSEGKYLARCDEILKKYSGAKTPAELLSSLAVGDLLALDGVVGARMNGLDVSSTTVSQHLIVLGLRFIASTGGSLKEKAAFYEWFRWRLCQRNE